MASWRDSIVEAMEAIGGEGVYEEIYAEVAARREYLPPSWQAIIRRTIQQASSDSQAYIATSDDLFYSVEGLGQGRWGLRGAPGRVREREGIAENPGGGQAYVSDSVVRKAIEQHAVTVAIEYYRGIGATQIVELGKPYDLQMKLADSELHVEVKGSLQSLSRVLLTRNEVIHARRTPGTELIVVDEIDLVVDADGAASTSGGRIRVWSQWAPAKESLRALVFEHTLDSSARLVSQRRGQAG